jgi:hypothetical protein
LPFREKASVNRSRRDWDQIPTKETVEEALLTHTATIITTLIVASVSQFDVIVLDIKEDRYNNYVRRSRSNLPSNVKVKSYDVNKAYKSSSYNYLLFSVCPSS